MDFKIKSDTLYTCDKYGNVIRKISNSVNNANFSDKQNIFVVTYLNGKVETVDTNGNRIRFICEGAQDAKFQDVNIIIRTKTENQLRDRYGNLIRRF